MIGRRLLAELWMRARGARMRAPALRRLREAKLRRLVRHAGTTVPLYRDLWRRAGVDLDEIRTVEDLVRLPTVTREQLQAAGDGARSEVYRSGDLLCERTSGSSGRPLTLWMEPAHRDLRRSLFLRALAAAGYRPGRRLVLVREPGRELPAGLDWRQLAHDRPPEDLAEEILRLRPAIVYGWVSVLRLVAEALVDLPPHGSGPRGAGSFAEPSAPSGRGPRALSSTSGDGRPALRASVLTTAEALDAAGRALLERAFGGRVHEVYGSTELGMVGWQCGRGDGFHLAEDVALLEAFDRRLDPAAGPRPLIATNLELRAMPLVRYETGDVIGPVVAQACRCGSPRVRVTGFEGRLVDCLRLPSGRLVSPYRLTLALEGLAGLARYRILQSAPARIEVTYQSAAGADCEGIEAAVRSRLRTALGEPVEITVERRGDLRSEVGSKFRVVESRMGACA